MSIFDQTTGLSLLHSYLKGTGIHVYYDKYVSYLG